MHADRWLEFEGLDNVRDVGGLPLVHGGATRQGVLLRGATLHYATSSDVTALVERVGVELILDLRTDRELVEDGPTKLAALGVETVQYSFIPEEGTEFPEVGEEFDPMVGHYLGYLSERAESVVAAIGRFAGAPGTTYVHCAAGKDRTGVFVALVLDAVGVERAAIVEDYALSARQLERMFRRWSAAQGWPMPADLDRHTPRAPAMEQVLGVLDERDGGAAGWLKANGLTDDVLAALRVKLT